MNISCLGLILPDNSVIENVDRPIALGTDHIELMMDGASRDGRLGRRLRPAGARAAR